MHRKHAQQWISVHESSDIVVHSAMCPIYVYFICGLIWYEAADIRKDVLHMYSDRIQLL